MANLASFRAFLIGADSLLLECAAHLLERGHELAGIVSDAPRLRAWAHERGVRSLSLADYPEHLRAEQFDYLFSITHLALIPEAVLRLPRRAAINFHDGPLPRYAGLNAPAWALLRGEREYGISWHLIDPDGGVDEGAVLEQRLFEIAPEETSLSLNTRNFAAAMDSFGDLVDKLAAGTASPQAQDLAQRSYFGKYMRPEAGCVLDLERPASELLSAVRALDFGDYDNPLGSPKLVHRGQPLTVRRAELRAESSAAAGCVSAVSADALELATGEGTLVVQALSDVYGRPVTPEAAAQLWQLEPGMQLEGLAEPLRDWLTEHATHLARSEDFWLARLRSLEPATLALAQHARGGGAAVALEIPLQQPARALALVCAYLARTSGKREFDLGYQSTGFPAELEAFFAVQLPLRVRVDESAGFEALVKSLEAELAAIATRGPCYRDTYARHTGLRAHPELLGGQLADVAVIRQRVLPNGVALALSIDASGKPELLCDPLRLPESARGLLRGQLLQLLAASEAEPARPIGELSLLPAAERELLARWNDTHGPVPDAHATVHGAFEAQCARTPERTAVIFEDHELSYAQLNALAERLAARLRAEGVGRDTLVGVFVERGLSLLIATLGIWKAGGAYLPLDPSYPAERLRFMREDSGARLIVSEAALSEHWPEGVQVIDAVQDQDASGEHGAPESRGSDLAYVIYTSGSTGQPKGVMVEHRQVLNFFAGMDDVVPHEQPNPVWLSVTSLSFDISVLELFWTLARGFTVVVYRDRARSLLEPVSRTMRAVRVSGRRPLEFSLFLWGAQDTRSDQTYRLMLEAARFGDQHGFAAIWTPERHFHAFGGPYPNPSVTGAALAAITQHMQIRAGSCVVPLHHPARVAEEWAVVDNLSNGRAAISFASGWQPDDFLLRPENYRENKRVMLEQIDQVRRLWRGEELSFAGPLGNAVQVRTQPRPIQPELPFWLTAAGHPDTFAMAGRLGANLLTHLLGQSLDELSEKIVIYRRARADAGLDSDSGKVTLMLHTFVGSTLPEVRARVREPMKEYLKSSVHLIKNFAWAFPAFKRPAGQTDQPDTIDIAGLSAEELDAVLEFAFERYFETSGLFGTPESCLPLLERLQAIGVDDVACLIDFGVPTEEVLRSLVQLDELRARSARPWPQPTAAALTLAEQISRYQVTHLQCTPSLLRMARGDDAGRAAIDGVPHLLLGGEAFPSDLASELGGHAGTVTNMYGPTETTVWSATHRLRGGGDVVPLGRPIKNTQLHVLDARQRPLPIGIPGELYIAGAGVVRGYHRRPELTDERFVPDPFAADGGKMYRTGDLVRWSASGVLEFLGRLDQQVKVRGHRIELGEIEALLLRQPGVREAAVIARGDHLVAYVSGEAAEDRLREAARASLPDFMLPSGYVFLRELPHTPNGKLDRKALPAPETLAAPARAYTPPENELEGKVVALWCEVLGRPQVGVNDNFFDIGGHSLLVVKLHRRLKAELAPELALTDVYRFPTVRALAAQIVGGGDNQAVEQAQDRAALRLERLSARRDLAQRRRPR